MILVVGGQLDQMILEVLSNFNDSMIQWCICVFVFIMYRKDCEEDEQVTQAMHKGHD